MIKYIIAAMLISCVHLVSAQDDDFDVVDDYSNSGQVSTNEPLPERYEVNEVEEFPLILINLNQLIGGDVLEVGKKYSFSFDNILNLLIGKDVLLSKVVMDCSCEEPNWQPSVIPPGMKGGFSANLIPAVRGPIETTVRVYLTDPEGLRPMAIQRIKLIYNAQ